MYPPSLYFTSQRKTTNVSSDCLDLIPTSEQFRENSFNHPISSQRLPHRTIKKFSQCEPNPVNDPIETSSDTTLSLPETLSLPSTPLATGQRSSTTFPTNFLSQIKDRYRELQKAPPPLFGQHLDSSRFIN